MVAGMLEASCLCRKIRIILQMRVCCVSKVVFRRQFIINIKVLLHCLYATWISRSSEVVHAYEKDKPAEAHVPMQRIETDNR